MDKDVLVSDNGFAKTTFDKINDNNLKYITLDNLEDLREERYRYLHFCVPYDDKFFYRLSQCIDMADKIQVVILHQPAERDTMIKFQRRTKMPIIYVPHGEDDDTWYWSMIGELSDALFAPFKKIMGDAGVKEEHKVMLGL